ncbi:MAG TPA: hypothetical protein VGQ69_05395 [Gemmatimonadales bacterium]|jgi:serine protease|nr:hypothetical protein [Gemmatimonadales bacterium]
MLRRALFLLGTAAAAGCVSDGGVGTGEISLAILPQSAGVAVGGSTTVAITLTRTGSFSGIVDLSVTGAPAGVTGGFSNLQTSGRVTTATLTLSVTAAATPGSYTLVVHASGTGVTEALAVFSLTIT